MGGYLLIEDDLRLGEHLQSTLRGEGLAIQWVSTVRGIEETLQNEERFDVIILDRLIGEVDTKDWLPRMKAAWPSAMVLVLSAINTPSERTELINGGADDYVGKPFSTEEVLARVRALGRRRGAPASQYLKLGNTVVDQIKRLVSVNDASVQLPAKEFLLLRALVREPGRVWSKDMLLDTVWGSSLETETNVVEATVTHLRKRLTDLGSELRIRNMRNAGYWIEA